MELNDFLNQYGSQQINFPTTDSFNAAPKRKQWGKAVNTTQGQYSPEELAFIKQTGQLDESRNTTMDPGKDPARFAIESVGMPLRAIERLGTGHYFNAAQDAINASTQKQGFFHRYIL